MITLSSRVFSNGNSQAVRIPAEFRLTASRVEITRTEAGDHLSVPRSSVGTQLWTLQRPDLEQGHEPKPIRHPGTG